MKHWVFFMANWSPVNVKSILISSLRSPNFVKQVVLMGGRRKDRGGGGGQKSHFPLSSFLHLVPSFTNSQTLLQNKMRDNSRQTNISILGLTWLKRFATYHCVCFILSEKQFRHLIFRIHIDNKCVLSQGFMPAFHGTWSALFHACFPSTSFVFTSPDPSVPEPECR